jgi:hypothetical protein
MELARDTALSRPGDLYFDAGVTDIDERWGAFPVDETSGALKQRRLDCPQGR